MNRRGSFLPKLVISQNYPLLREALEESLQKFRSDNEKLYGAGKKIDQWQIFLLFTPDCSVLRLNLFFLLFQSVSSRVLEFLLIKTQDVVY